MMAKYIAFHKPYLVLSKFSDQADRATLKDYVNIPGIYPAGRLDYRSEGLLILSDDKNILHILSDPDFNHQKKYHAQVEGEVSPEAVLQLNNEIVLPGIQTKFAQISVIDPPDFPERVPPIRKYHPTTWLSVTIGEGKKHQVRRMTAAVGYPTLRLIRVGVGPFSLDQLPAGQFRDLCREKVSELLSNRHRSA
jgi:23S rRNA pseudouridine2457 synthase